MLLTTQAATTNEKVPFTILSNFEKQLFILAMGSYFCSSVSECLLPGRSTAFCIMAHNHHLKKSCITSCSYIHPAHITAEIMLLLVFDYILRTDQTVTTFLLQTNQLQKNYLLIPGQTKDVDLVAGSVGGPTELPANISES